MNYNRKRGGNPSFGWPHPDFLSRGSATQHAGFVSRPVDVPPSTSWDLPFQQQGCTGFQPYEGPTPTSWDHPTTRVGEFHVPCSYWEPTAPRGTSTQVTSSMPLSPPSSVSSPYEFDPILGRPRTSWDLPRPRIAPESCSNHSYSESYRGGGGYSNNYNDYYNNEPQAWTYKPPQPTPCYNHVPQSVQCEPQPPAQYYAEPQQQPYYPPPPSHTHGQTTVTSPAMPSPLELHQSPPTAETLDEQDRAANLELCDMINHEGFSRVDLIRGMKKRIMLESPRIQYLSLELLESVAKNCEKAFSATAATKEKMDQKENKDAEMMENRIIDMKAEEEGDVHSVVQSSAAVIHDDEREKNLELTDELMACGLVVKEGDDSVVAFAKEDDELEWAFAYSNFGRALLSQAQEGADPFGFMPNKKGEGPGKKMSKSREVSRRSTIFGIYALEEVYKDLLNLHLEDKVILEGGGVDTLFILISCN